MTCWAIYAVYICIIECKSIGRRVCRVKVPVAVKCLANDKLKTEMTKFLLEAANMCSVDHEHIVQLYGVVLGSDSLMLVLTLSSANCL